MSENIKSADLYPEEHLLVLTVIPVQRIPGNEDKSGSGDLLPLPIHHLLQVHGGLGRGAAHPGHVA
jgi:hypothetical protein